MLSTVMEFEKNASAGYLVNHLARLFARGLTARIRPLGLSTGVFPALLELWENDGLTQSQLVQRLDIEQATMAGTLARMERDGLVLRQRDPSDGRVQRIWLTPHARGLRQAATQAAIDENQAALSHLTEVERAQFIALMTRILTGRGAAVA